MLKLNKGYIQVYTGNGKGKTTAAIGQAVRAAGSGLSVYMVQFLKTADTGEYIGLKKFYPQLQVFIFERPRGFFWTLNESEKKELQEDIDRAYDFCLETIKNRTCDVLIMDEIMGVITNKLLTQEQVMTLLDNKPEDMEIVMTGRDVPSSILQRADLVTEMKDIKHYMDKGVGARKGIEY